MTTTQHRFPIVIALDDSEYSEIVLEHALDQAARHDRPDLHVITVIAKHADPVAAKSKLAQTVLEGLDAFRDGRDGWRTRLHVRFGDAAAEIAGLTEEVQAELLVIGRYGVHRRRRSVVDTVMANVSCPTLVVGLAGREVASEPQCPECVLVRAESEGESWFCTRHSGDRVGLSALVPATTGNARGLW